MLKHLNAKQKLIRSTLFTEHVYLYNLWSASLLFDAGNRQDVGIPHIYVPIMFICVSDSLSRNASQDVLSMYLVLENLRTLRRICADCAHEPANLSVFIFAGASWNGERALSVRVCVWEGGMCVCMCERERARAASSAD